MRRSTLPFVLGCVLSFYGCGDPPGDRFVAIPDFLEQATPTSCDTILTDGEFAVTQLRTATDSTWLLLDEPQRQILEFTGDLRQVWSLPYRSEGPGSLVNPSGVAPLGDSAFAVVDRGSLRLMVLDRAGEELYSTPLGFLPNTVATTPDGQVLVTPLPIENRPGTLLVRFDGGEQTELPVPPRYYESFMVRALGNTALVETLADGSAVVMHQYMAPRGFLVDPDGEARQLTVPMPDGTVRQASFVPTIPLTDDQQSRIMLPAASMSVDRRRSELFVLTRSGGRVNDRAERAILRLGRDLSFIEGFTIPLPAIHQMAVVPAHGVAIVVDENDQLYSCTLPLDKDNHGRAE